MEDIKLAAEEGRQRPWAQQQEHSGPPFSSTNGDSKAGAHALWRIYKARCIEYRQHYRNRTPRAAAGPVPKEPSP